MPTFSLNDAQERLEELLERACSGEEIIIERHERLSARLVPCGTSSGPRLFGALQGQVEVRPEFFEPLPDNDMVD